MTSIPAVSPAPSGASLSAEQARTLLDAARASIRNALGHDTPPGVPADADPRLLQPAGCFVTLHDLRTHALRGCIGRIESPLPLLQTVIETAMGTLEDPRFAHNAVTRDELARLEIEISVLTPLQQASSPLDFEPGRDGILLVFGNRTGVFLPQVSRDTGWTKEQLLDRLASEKMGLSPLVWRNPHAKLFRFQVEIIGPEPFVRKQP